MIAALPSVQPPSSDPRARVLIVDDSVVARAVIARAIDASGRFVVAGSVANAAAARAALAQLCVDFILLDIAMPGIDGLTALPDLIDAGQGARVVIVSAAASAGAAATIRALALGAADTLVKPGAGELQSRFADALIGKLDDLHEGGDNTAARAGVPGAPSTSAHAARASEAGYDIVAIGASTGGIHALSHLLRAIPAEFRLPILVTQHLPVSFMPFFAAQLSVLAGRPCDVATDRMRIRPGRIVVAPGDAHIACVSLGDAGAAIRLTHEPSFSGCMPSVDPMFATLAEVYGPRVMAIVLSGMGRDGAEGARVVHAAGGCVVVQDQTSSVVWGMPGAVAAANCADAMLPPDAIGRLVAAGKRP